MSPRYAAHLLLGRPAERTGPLGRVSASPDGPSDAQGASWLVLLRWVAAAGQLTTVVVVRFGLGIALPLAPLLGVVAVTAVSNLALAAWSSRHEGGSSDDGDARSAPVLGSVMLLDLVLLTTLLFYTGGAENPFFVFFFVNLCLHAVVLPRVWAWAGNLLAILCFVLLFFAHRPLAAPFASGGQELTTAGTPTLAGWGLLTAFVTCSAVIVYFTSLLRRQFQKRGRQLQAFHAERGRTQKLEALGTLAAGAAHELANPLATIAVVAREVERRVGGTVVEPIVAKDIALIRSELETCRNILKRMSGDAGQAMGERLVTVTPAALIAEVVDGLRAGNRITAAVDPAAAVAAIDVPLVGLAQAIRGIVQNALSASTAAQPVRITADRIDGRLRLVVRDEGTGMSPAVLERVGDPFFTTKQPGHGTGLGVFLARAVVERLGGRLSIESAAGRGTAVTILLPTGKRLQSTGRAVRGV